MVSQVFSALRKPCLFHSCKTLPFYYMKHVFKRCKFSKANVESVLILNPVFNGGNNNGISGPCSAYYFCCGNPVYSWPEQRHQCFHGTCLWVFQDPSLPRRYPDRVHYSNAVMRDHVRSYSENTAISVPLAQMDRLLLHFMAGIQDSESKLCF